LLHFEFRVPTLSSRGIRGHSEGGWAPEVERVLFRLGPTLRGAEQVPKGITRRPPKRIVALTAIFYLMHL